MQEIRRHLNPDDRYVNCTARLVVYVRGDDDRPRPFLSYLKIYGGVYDRVAKRYVRDEAGELVMPKPGDVHEIDCHPGQVQYLTLHRKK